MSCIAKMNRNLSRCRYHPDNTHRCIRGSLHADDHRCFCGEVFMSPTGLESLLGTTRHRAREVQGYCPMGCGQTLFLAAGNYITCSYASCPRPDAAADLLNNRETHHIVEFGEDTFTVRHPLRERLDDALLTCQLDKHIASLDGPPVKPGRYRARPATNGWEWEQLPAKEATTNG